METWTTNPLGEDHMCIRVSKVIVGGSGHWGDRVGGLTLACVSLQILRVDTLPWVGLPSQHCPVPQEGLCGILLILSTGLLPERPRHQPPLTPFSCHPERPESPEDFIWTGWGVPRCTHCQRGNHALYPLALPSMSSPAQTCQFPGN